MNTYSRIVVFIIVFCTLIEFGYAQDINQNDSKGLKTGHWQIKYSNDSLKSDGYYKAGKPIGLWKYFYDTGELMAYMEYLTDGITSNFKLFDVSGPRIAEGLYIKGKKDAQWHYYGIDSSKVGEETYIKGVKTGEEKIYYPGSGKLFQSTIFTNDKKNGWYKQFYQDAVIKTDGNFVNDTLVGKVTYYHPNGKKNLEGIYVKGLRDGEFYVYDEKGKLAETLHYKMGKLDEKDELRHLNGEIKVVYPEDVIYQGGYEHLNPNGNR